MIYLYSPSVQEPSKFTASRFRSTQVLRLLLPVALLFFGSLTGYTQTVSGTVFRDFNADGQRQALADPNSQVSAGEPGVEGVTVKAFASGNAAPVATASTDSTGAYILPVGGAGPFRVEFSGFQIGDFSGAAGAGSGTSVQFAPGGASNINLSINYPADYCSTDNPQMVTSCFVAINAEDSPPLGLRDALVGVPYQSVDNTKVVSHYGVVNEMGAIWGLAYQRDTKRIFSAAFTKRHVGFGPGGPGAIYATTVGASDTTTAEFFNFGTAAGTDMHTDVPSEVTANDRLDSYDIPAYDAVGKTSLGDIDISDDGKTLYVVNLFNRKLYSLDIATKDTVAYAIPDPGCQGSDFRPFATKFYRGKVYVGVVCSNESTPNDTTIAQTANMLATVYAFEAGSFTPVLTFPLNYIKAPTNADLTPVTNVARANRWRPWTDTFRADRNTSLVSYPQPWLTDIEFDVDGDMIVGLRDRYGDQMGYFNRKPIANDPDLVSAVSPGEILRAGPCGPGGTWLIENNGSVCGSTASAIQSNQAGPGGGKYYWGDRVQNGGNHGMSSMASFALLAGSGKVAMTAIDPTEIFNTGGIKRMLNPTGAKDGNPTGTSSNISFGAKSGTPPGMAIPPARRQTPLPGSSCTSPTTWVTVKPTASAIWSCSVLPPPSKLVTGFGRIPIKTVFRIPASCRWSV